VEPGNIFQQKYFSSDPSRQTTGRFIFKTLKHIILKFNPVEQM